MSIAKRARGHAAPVLKRAFNNKTEPEIGPCAYDDGSTERKVKDSVLLMRGKSPWVARICESAFSFFRRGHCLGVSRASSPFNLESSIHRRRSCGPCHSAHLVLFSPSLLLLLVLRLSVSFSFPFSFSFLFLFVLAPRAPPVFSAFPSPPTWARDASESMARRRVARASPAPSGTLRGNTRSASRL